MSAFVSRTSISTETGDETFVISSPASSDPAERLVTGDVQLGLYPFGHIRMQMRRVFGRTFGSTGKDLFLALDDWSRPFRARSLRQTAYGAVLDELTGEMRKQLARRWSRFATRASTQCVSCGHVLGMKKAPRAPMFWFLIEIPKDTCHSFVYRVFHFTVLIYLSCRVALVNGGQSGLVFSAKIRLLFVTFRK